MGKQAINWPEQWFKYCVESARTDNGSSLVVIALGLAGESAEVYEATFWAKEEEIRKEIGDVLWYLARMCVHKSWRYGEGGVRLGSSLDLAQTFGISSSGGGVLHLSVPDAMEARRTNETESTAAAVHLMRLAGKFSDHVKKAVAQGHPVDEAEVKDLASRMWRWCALLAVQVGGRTTYRHDLRHPLQIVLDENIAKLKVRYPEQFEVTRSVNRDSEEVSASPLGEVTVDSTDAGPRVASVDYGIPGTEHGLEVHARFFSPEELASTASAAQDESPEFAAAGEGGLGE